MLERFRQPYPLSDNPSRIWVTALATALFVSFFLFLFRPFGLQSLPPTEAPLLIGGYGMITFICVILNLFMAPLLLPQVFREERWTTGHEFIFLMWIVMTIGVGNAVYTAVAFGRSLTLLTILYFQLITLMVAVFPVSFILLLKQNRLLRKNQEHAKELSDRIRRYQKSDDEDIITLTGQNAGDLLSLPGKDILYINAADNYIDVGYLKEGAETRKLIRSSLKTARDQVRTHSSLYRCHRSWIVNLDKVIRVTGNAQGYRLILEGTSVNVPVSRALNSELDARLAK
jgi:DNA-binding LytR/AlgR family response regulator